MTYNNLSKGKQYLIVIYLIPEFIKQNKYINQVSFNMQVLLDKFITPIKLYQYKNYSFSNTTF